MKANIDKSIEFYWKYNVGSISQYIAIRFKCITIYRNTFLLYCDTPKNSLCNTLLYIMHGDIVKKDQYTLIHLAYTFGIPRCSWMIEEIPPCDIFHNLSMSSIVINRDSVIIHDKGVHRSDHVLSLGHYQVSCTNFLIRLSILPLWNIPQLHMNFLANCFFVSIFIDALATQLLVSILIDGELSTGNVIRKPRR